jgi:protocatechuate 3,4-dioxygenase beta subunit
MKRKDFLKGVGFAGVASILPFGHSFSMPKGNEKGGNCVLIPSETAGPFPLDFSGDNTMFRTDVRETQEGVTTKVRMKIISANDCNPIANARVDIWHCNAYGYYSGYNTNGQNGPINYVGETWLRGIQITDANGEVEFITMFPGWYSGRIAHIHFQVFLSSVLQVTSQFAFPVEEKNILYTNNLPYSNYGEDPITFATDGVFTDGYALQLATLTEVDGEYFSEIEIAINAQSSTGLLKIEPETGGQFKLNQNFPNPYKVETSIPFVLMHNSDVKIELFDINGKKVSEIKQNNLPKGENRIVVNTDFLGITKSNYVYQLEVTNKNGVFRQCKMMTAE